MTETIWVFLFAAAACSALAVGLTLHVAKRLTFFDRPGTEPHKRQSTAVPYGGGIGMAVAFLVCLLPAWSTLPADGTMPESVRLVYRGPLILVAAATLFLLGLWDDRRPVPAKLKFTLQGIICAVVVWAADLGIDSLRAIPLLSYGLAWAWLVVVSNAYNLMDHADGLSGSVALVSVCVLLIGSVMGDNGPMALMWAVLIGCLAGFLAWNLPPARIYMGDAGSLPLGFLIGVGTLTVTFWPASEGGSPLAILSPLLITAIPLFDTAAVVVKRWRHGRPIMQGDRSHISHRLTRLGLGPLSSLGAIVALQIALAAGTLQLRQQDWVPGVVVLAQAAAILLAVVFLETARDAES